MDKSIVEFISENGFNWKNANIKMDDRLVDNIASLKNEVVAFVEKGDWYEKYSSEDGVKWVKSQSNDIITTDQSNTTFVKRTKNNEISVSNDSENWLSVRIKDKYKTFKLSANQFYLKDNICYYSAFYYQRFQFKTEGLLFNSKTQTAKRMLIAKYDNNDNIEVNPISTNKELVESFTHFVTFPNKTFLAAGRKKAANYKDKKELIVATSVDMKNWLLATKESDLENDFCSGILQVENRAFLTYIDCSYISIYDSVEKTWLHLDFEKTIKSIFYINNIYFAITNNQTIIISKDAKTWQMEISVDFPISKIKMVNDKIIVFGLIGKVAVSDVITEYKKSLEVNEMKKKETAFKDKLSLEMDKLNADEQNSFINGLLSLGLAMANINQDIKIEEKDIISNCLSQYIDCDLIYTDSINNILKDGFKNGFNEISKLSNINWDFIKEFIFLVALADGEYDLDEDYFIEKMFETEKNNYIQKEHNKNVSTELKVTLKYDGNKKTELYLDDTFYQTGMLKDIFFDETLEDYIEEFISELIDYANDKNIILNFEGSEDDLELLKEAVEKSDEEELITIV